MMHNKQISQNALNSAKNYVSWWREAGVDYLVEGEASSWLEEEKPEYSAETVEETKALTKAPTPAPSVNDKILPQSEWPSDIDSMMKMLADGALLPGNHYGGKTALPSLIKSSKYALICDLPSQIDIDSGKIASGIEGQLLSNMMRAIGCDIKQASILSLSTSRPASGALPAEDFSALKEFLSHQLSLIAPEYIISFGSTVCTALFNAELMKMRGNLHYFNHKVQKVASVTTFHPRTLLKRPQMKAQAWKDLQVLLK